MLTTCQQGAPTDKLRDGLDQRSMRRALHLLHKMHNRVTLHIAVSVENDHMVVAPTPPHNEIANVTGFAMVIDGAPTIANRNITPDRF